jgi:tight adherence protein C
MIGIALLAVLLIGASAALTTRALSMPRVRAARALAQIHDYGYMSADRVVLDEEESRRSLVEVVGAVIAPRLGRERLASIRRSLLGAGLHSTPVERYLGYYALSVLLVPLLLVWFASQTGAQSTLAVFEIVIGMLIGIMVPQALLNRRARHRLEQIDSEIPELVDLLLVGVEGGMGFNGAIRASSPRIEGPLGEELLLLLQQQSLGASSTEALENLLARCDTPGVHSLVRTVVQGEKLGVSIGQLMRSLAEEMRKRRKALAEEKAGKIPIKILFPLVFVVLPSMFIIVLTPAVANIINSFSTF